MSAMSLSSSGGGAPIHPQAPMTAPLITNNLPPQQQPFAAPPPPLFGQQQQPPPPFSQQQQPPPLFSQQQQPPPLFGQHQPLLQNSVASGHPLPPQNISPAALPPNLPTIMSTSAVSSYQPATLVASTESSVPLYSAPSQPQLLVNGGYQMAVSQPPPQSQLFTGSPPLINNTSPPVGAPQMQPPMGQSFVQPPPPQMQPLQASIPPQISGSFSETKSVPLMTDISLDASPQLVQQIPTQPQVVVDQTVQLT